MSDVQGLDQWRNSFGHHPAGDTLLGKASGGGGGGLSQAVEWLDMAFQHLNIISKWISILLSAL
jgi:hypothetical protein